MNTKTKWQDFLSTLKMILFAIPFVWLILGAKEKYQDFHLKNYRRLTPGLVVNTFSQPNNRGGTTSYYAIVVYKIDNIQMQKACYMHPSEYHKGDSVLIAYSFKDPDFYELAGPKTTK